LIDDAASKMKIFGVGFHKTGTSSLHRFFLDCGLTARHWPWIEGGVDYGQRCAPFLNEPKKVIEVLRPIIDRYDAHTDVPYPGLYRELADAFPDAYFILTRRNVDSWWESIAHHWAIHILPRRLEPFEYIQYRQYVPERTRIISRWHRRMLCEAHARHISAVEAFFAAHDRFISLDLADENKGQRLADFLGKPVTPFSQANPRMTHRARLKIRYRRWTGKHRRDAINASLAVGSPP